MFTKNEGARKWTEGVVNVWCEVKSRKSLGLNDHDKEAMLQ